MGDLHSLLKNKIFIDFLGEVMKCLIFLACFLVFSCNNGSIRTVSNSKVLSPSYNNSSNEEGIIEDEFIIKTLKDFDASSIANIEVVSKLDLNDYNYYLVKTTPTGKETFKDEVKTLEGVVYLENNRYLSLPKIENRKAMYKPFGILDGEASSDEDYELYGYALHNIKALDYIDENGEKQQGAYSKVGYGDEEVVVAIIDSGLNMNHKDFYRDGKSICLYAKSAFEKDVKHISGNYYDQYPNKDFLRELEVPSNEDIGDTEIIPESGHGTHCAGSICATGENGGVLGVAWKNTKIISYKAFSVYNYGVTSFATYGSLGDLAETVAILKKEPSERTQKEREKLPSTVPESFRISQKTIPLNMSIGGPIGDFFENEMLNKAISQDILPVIAMGNDGRTRSVFPAATFGTLGVGATTKYDRRAPFTNSGAWMSVCAPGMNIVSTFNGHWSFPKWDAVPSSDEAGFSLMSGTSMAAPCVTGLITYLLSFSEARSLTPYQIKRILEITSDRIDEGNYPYGFYDGNGYSEYYGYGRVNALEAALCIKGKSDKSIPLANSFYIETPCTVKTLNGNIKVFLYEAHGMRCVGIGHTGKESKELKFYGLKKDTSYIVKAILSEHKIGEWSFVANETIPIEHTFK